MSSPKPTTELLTALDAHVNRLTNRVANGMIEPETGTAEIVQMFKDVLTLTPPDKHPGDDQYEHDMATDGWHTAMHAIRAELTKRLSAN